MLIDDLPTNDVWDTYDWRYVLAGSEFYEGAFTAPDGRPVPDITPDRIDHVEVWAARCSEGMGDRDFAALVRLTDGTWAACLAWCDTSGWGCQQGVYWRVCADRADIQRYGLDDKGRRMLTATEAS